jgi:exodeoxyribonuclease V alpha subunit
VKRFGGEIARASNHVRAGHWPALLGDTNAPVAFVECETDRLAETVLRLYREDDPVTTQILCFTKEAGSASTKALNAKCQTALAPHAQPLRVFSAERERLEDTGLRVGDPLICTRNLWAHNLQNGSLGHLESIESVPVPFFNSDGKETAKTYAWARWDDNKLRPVTDEVLDALELAYAITVHKAQGSGFRRVIVPVFASRICDRTMLYTAMTRAASQVIFVGDLATAKRVVESPPRASRRKVALARLIEGLA